MLSTNPEHATWARISAWLAGIFEIAPTLKARNLGLAPWCAGRMAKYARKPPSRWCLSNLTPVPFDRLATRGLPPIAA